MIIGKDSVLYKIPTALNRRQALFIEGIRFSIEMADMAHRRLRKTLLRLPRADTDPENDGTVSVMLDAWSIIDALHRIRGLLKHMPGIEKRSRAPEIRAFWAATEQVPELRNTIQHLDTTISKVVDDKNWAVLGSVSWGIIDVEKKEVTTFTFIPGMAMGSRPSINPLSRKQWHVPVDSITIERSGVAVCLSDAMRRLASLAAGLERNLARAYTQQIPNPEKHQAADIILGIVMRIEQKQILAENTPEGEVEVPLSNGCP